MLAPLLPKEKPLAVDALLPLPNAPNPVAVPGLPNAPKPEGLLASLGAPNAEGVVEAPKVVEPNEDVEPKAGFPVEDAVPNGAELLALPNAEVVELAG